MFFHSHISDFSFLPPPTLTPLHCIYLFQICNEHFGFSCFFYGLLMSFFHFSFFSISLLEVTHWWKYIFSHTRTHYSSSLCNCPQDTHILERQRVMNYSLWSWLMKKTFTQVARLWNTEGRSYFFSSSTSCKDLFYLSRTPQETKKRKLTKALSKLSGIVHWLCDAHSVVC